MTWITKQEHPHFVESPTVTLGADPNGWYLRLSDTLRAPAPLYCVGASRQEAMGSAGERTR